jgi:hypothetical protein
MDVSDLCGAEYTYQGETITIEARLTQAQHHACFEAAGIAVPGFDPNRRVLTIEPPGAREASRLRRYLREQHIEHDNELAVGFDPAASGEIADLAARAGSEPMRPGALADAALKALTRHRDLGDRAAIAILRRRFGPQAMRCLIEREHAREREIQDLVALATSRGLTDGALDNEIHGGCAQNASDINNGGIEDQIRYLVARGEAAAVKRLIEETAS